MTEKPIVGCNNFDWMMLALQKVGLPQGGFYLFLFRLHHLLKGIDKLERLFVYPLLLSD